MRQAGHSRIHYYLLPVFLLPKRKTRLLTDLESIISYRKNVIREGRKRAAGTTRFTTKRFATLLQPVQQ